MGFRATGRTGDGAGAEAACSDPSFGRLTGDVPLPSIVRFSTLLVTLVTFGRDGPASLLPLPLIGLSECEKKHRGRLHFASGQEAS